MTTVSLMPSLSCPPRWGTRRDLSRPTLGPRVAQIAEMLGTPLHPWQRHVADVALEIDPDTGLLAYSEIGLTVPRQSGKTTLTLAVMAHRALAFGPPTGPRQNIIYAAQTRNDSRKKFEDEHVLALQASPLRKQFRVRMTNGNEAILWKNGSKHGITSTTEKAGHGEVLDLGMLDEAFSQPDDRVEQAMKPAMVTRRNAQFWWTSTAGKASSVYLLDKVEQGRKAVEAGLDRGLAFFEWSADPDADPADPVTWRGCMPALGLTALEESVANFQRTMRPAEFRRAFLNIADTAAAAEWEVIPEDAWRARADAGSRPVDPVAFAVDVSPDRKFAYIGAAGGAEGGGTHVELIDHREGTSWVVPRVLELIAKWKPCAVVVDPGSHAGSLIDSLTAAGVDVKTPSVREIAQGCGQLFDAVCGDDPTLRHRDQGPLSAAVAGAQKRPLADMWAWDRRSMSVDVRPLVAVTLALWGFMSRDQTQFAPMVMWR